MTSSDGDGGQRLAVMTADGRRLHGVTPAPDGGIISADATWSPRGDLLLVEGETSYYSTPPQPIRSYVYVVAARGGARHYLSFPVNLNVGYGGVWSPDERFIAAVVVDQTPAASNGSAGVKVEIYPVLGGPARTVVTASVPPPAPETSDGLQVSDWQAAPGSAHPIQCADGRAPF